VKNLLFIVLGIAGLTLGSKLLVDSAVQIAGYFGVSELIIGLTIVSLGTSLPEVATSIIAAVRGERDIAVGNIVGSNIFNIASVMGLASAVAPAGINVQLQALHFDIPVMIGIAVACFPVFFRRYLISRLHGACFLGFYFAYLVYLYLSATGHEGFAGYQHVLFRYVLPATVLVLCLMTVGGWMGRKRRLSAGS
jgi:cation:H+ antiporter